MQAAASGFGLGLGNNGFMRGGLGVGRNFKSGFGIVEKYGQSSGINKVSIISDSEYLRIENAATRIKKPIIVVGSRASGTAKAGSDWDYIIEGFTSRDWSKIKNSLPGSRSVLNNTPRNIDIFKGSLDTKRPHIIINPR